MIPCTRSSHRWHVLTSFQTIDKLDKDNFGLKLKIHYLQEQLEKAGPAYNQAALRENTELKVSRMTMQRDISRYRKNLQQAERDLEAYRLQFQELREKYRTKSMDETAQHELSIMREEIETKDAQLRDLREELRDIKENKSQDMEKLRDEIEDLEASLREKDRIIDTRDEEIEELKDRDGKENNSVAELENELQRAKDQMEELQESLEQARLDSREAKEAEDRAAEERERAEKDLNELHEEMANKSISTKGFNRQLEEKANRLEDELQELRKENEALSAEVESKTRREAGLEEQFQKAQQEMDKEERDMQLELDHIRRERDLIQEQHEKVSAQLQDALDNVQRHNDEKDLLQTRHNALTDESGGLQQELSHAQSRIRDLQHSLEEEKHRSADNGHSVRIQYREETEKLQDEIEALHHEIEDKEGQFALEQDKWESSKRTLQLQKDRAEDQAAGFKRTIEKLEQVEHTLTGKEDKLQEVIDSEKTRHQNAEAVLSRQVKELNDDLTSKRQFLDDQRSELLSVKEELRIAKREETALREKVQALEDEVVVLQSSLEDEQQYGKGRMQKGSSDQENQVQKLISEKQRLRDQLANAHVELHDMQTAVSELEAERDELQNNAGQAQDPADNTTRFDREKLELRKGSLRLENEVKRLKDDKSALEEQLNAEIERGTAEENQLSAEIDRLQDRLQAGSGGRDRELTSAKSKVQRLERRIRELEELLEQQQPLAEDEHTVSKADHSMLRHSLDESRKREKALLQRESEQKTFVRNCKSRIADLERDLHDALMKKFDVKSPQSSPSDKLHQELRSLRKQLGEAHKALKEVKSKNRDLERAAMKDEDQKDIHELLKSSTLEVEALELQLSERDAKLNEMRTQVRRIRDERAFCAKKAETANSHVESLQNRYNQTLAKLSSSKNDNDKSRHEKEILGLGKEIVWLRARLKREEKFRRDLAWSKGLMELGERVRVAWFVIPFHLMISSFLFLVQRANMVHLTTATMPTFE